MGEVLLGVIDDLVRANRSDHVHVPRAAHAGHVRSERFGDLDGERANASRRAVDHHLLPRLDLPLIANGIEGGEGRVSDGRGLLKREVGRLRQQVVLFSTRVFGKGAVAPAENLIAWLKLLHAVADRFNLPRQIESRYLVLRLEQPDRRTHRVRDAPEEVPVADIDGRGANAHQHLVFSCDRLVDVLELKDIG